MSAPLAAGLHSLEAKYAQGDASYASLAHGAGVSLDRLASNVSPQEKCGCRDNHVTRQKKSDPGYFKRRRHKLRRVSGGIVGGRTAACGRKVIGNAVHIHKAEHGHFYSGLETCGSVWVCPVCAAKITEGRRVEIDAALKGHAATGGSVFMATLTMPHHKFQSPNELRKGVASAWRKIKSGKRWQVARAYHGWAGDIRALEVTHGDNGWHPHLHVLIFFENPGDNPLPLGFGDWLFAAWEKAIHRLCFGRCARDAFRYEPVECAKGAAKYVSKWGAAQELTKAHIKKSSNGLTPWQLLEDAAAGDDEARRLFGSYGRAFKGARQLTWSRGLRDRYAEDGENCDDQLASSVEEALEHVAAIQRDVWNRVEASDLTAEVLCAADRGGVEEICVFLNAVGVGVRRSDGNGSIIVKLAGST